MAKCPSAVASPNPTPPCLGMQRRPSKSPAPASASPATSIGSTSPATAARAGARLQDRPAAQGQHRPGRRQGAAALPLCLRRQGAARRGCRDQRLAALSRATRSISSSTDPEATLTEITGYLQAARANLLSGAGLLGPDTGGDYDDLAFALPANAGATYCKRKIAAATERLGDAAQVWEAQ